MDKQQKNTEIIKVRELIVSYEEDPVLWDVNLDIKQGVLLAVVGPNGAGKSTLIKAILGLIKTLSGKITFWGKKYEKVRNKIAYVPQRGSVDWDFPTTVFDVVEMGRYGQIGWLKKVRKEDKVKTIDALEKVQMLEFKDRQISQLSGGQQQRGFLARALVQEAEIYFMDEPFQGVDTKTEKSIVNILKKLRNEGKTVITVHHDLQTVPEYFDHVLFINKGVVAYGSVEEIFTQENISKTYNLKESKEVE